MSLGNDVVDLGDPEARLEGLHPRFAGRVFTPAERAALEASPDRLLLHWAFWAAKESAYKALVRVEPGTVFAPRAFEVELPGVWDGDGCCGGKTETASAGRVRYGARSFAVEVSRRGDALHAVAVDDEDGDPAPGTVLREIGIADDEPGAAVRRLAVRALGAALRPGRAPVRIVGRPPVAVAGPLGLVVSLSHHGRFVAFAARVRRYHSRVTRQSTPVSFCGSSPPSAGPSTPKSTM